jgi:hypothetical protein
VPHLLIDLTLNFIRPETNFLGIVSIDYVALASYKNSSQAKSLVFQRTSYFLVFGMGVHLMISSPLLFVDATNDGAYILVSCSFQL